MDKCEKIYMNGWDFVEKPYNTAGSLDVFVTWTSHFAGDFKIGGWKITVTTTKNGSTFIHGEFSSSMFTGEWFTHIIWDHEMDMCNYWGWK